MAKDRDQSPKPTRPAPSHGSSSTSKPGTQNTGLIGQTGNRPGGTATGSYKHIGEDREKRK
jgi:hypothetical protein